MLELRTGPESRWSSQVPTAERTRERAISSTAPEYFVTTHTTAEKALANIIYEHYDLGEIKMPKTLERVHQRRHRKFVIDTEKGQFLLKTYKNDPEVLDALRFQHRLSAHLD